MTQAMYRIVPTDDGTRTIECDPNPKSLPGRRGWVIDAMFRSGFANLPLNAAVEPVSLAGLRGGSVT